jgi:hypothetical protein
LITGTVPILSVWFFCMGAGIVLNRQVWCFVSQGQLLLRRSL